LNAVWSVQHVCARKGFGRLTDVEARSVRDRSKSGRPRRLDGMVRKSAELWPDQATCLNRLAERIRRQHRGSGGDVVTANTLIRAAVDLYLVQHSAITGATENDIRAALGLAPRDDTGKMAVEPATLPRRTAHPVAPGAVSQRPGEAASHQVALQRDATTAGSSVRNVRVRAASVVRRARRTTGQGRSGGS
jgi:hypothetical protein